MTNEKDMQNEKLESLLRKARLPEPLSELRERITAESTRVWRQTSAELSWRIPFMRLVASAAAAVFIVWLTNFSSDYSMARWQTRRLTPTNQKPSELDVLPEMPYGPFVRYLASVSRELPASDASGLRDYVETVRRLLDEAPQDEVLKPLAPTGSRSRLLPGRSNPSSYS
jgi:hypothetical protein